MITDDPDAGPEEFVITCWRDVAVAFRIPGRRVYAAAASLAMVLKVVAVFAAYLLCLLFALLAAAGVDVWGAGPALKAAFGHVPHPGLVSFAVRSVVGGLAFWVDVRLMNRAAAWAGNRLLAAWARKDAEESQ